MTKQKTHWKKMFNYDYLGAWSLENGQDKNVTIVKMDRALVKSAQHPKGEDCPVVHFKEFDIPMVLNPTNCKTIEQMYGAYTEDWIGKRITLYVKTGIKAFGTTTDALRVREKSPVKPELKPGSKKWEGACKSMAEGNVTIEQIEATYSLTEENRLKLCSCSK